MKCLGIFLGLCAYVAGSPVPSDEFDIILKDAAHGILKADPTIVTPEPIQDLTDLDRYLDYPRLSRYQFLIMIINFLIFLQTINWKV